MRLILVCLSCGYEREVWSRLKECPRCNLRDIEVLKSYKAVEQGIEVPTDARPDLARKMKVVELIGIILLMVGAGLIGTGIMGVVGFFVCVPLLVIGIICGLVGAIGHWWYS